MKQFFIALVFMNLGYLLLQAVSGDDSAQPPAASPAVAGLGGGFKSAKSSLAPRTHTTPAAASARFAEVEAQAAAPDPIKLTSQTSARQSASCAIAGPFTSKRSADAMVAQLEDDDITATRQPRNVELLPDYMVYVGPHESLQEAKAIVAGFDVRKMDSHILASGNLRNAVSLGVFSQGPFAQSLYEQLQTQGYDVKIAPITRNRQGYQVQAILPPKVRARLVDADTPVIDCPEQLAASVPSAPVRQPGLIASAGGS